MPVVGDDVPRASEVPYRVTVFYERRAAEGVAPDVRFGVQTVWAHNPIEARQHFEKRAETHTATREWRASFGPIGISWGWLRNRQEYGR